MKNETHIKFSPRTANALFNATKALVCELQEQCRLSGTKYDELPELSKAKALISKIENRSK